MAVLHVKSPNGTVHDIELTTLNTPSDYSGNNVWTRLPNGVLIQCGLPSTVFIVTGGQQRFGWAIGYTVAKSVVVNHITVTGRPINVCVVGFDVGGCDVFCWDTAAMAYPDHELAFHYIAFVY